MLIAGFASCSRDVSIIDTGDSGNVVSVPSEYYVMGNAEVLVPTEYSYTDFFRMSDGGITKDEYRGELFLRELRSPDYSSVCIRLYQPDLGEKTDDLEATKPERYEYAKLMCTSPINEPDVSDYVVTNQYDIEIMVVEVVNSYGIFTLIDFIIDEIRYEIEISIDSELYEQVLDGLLTSIRPVGTNA